MKTFLKIVAGLLVLLIILIAGLNIYFTDERLKEVAMPYISEAVDRPVQAESMSLTFFSTFPQPGLSIEQLFIPGETDQDTLLAMDEMTASVELFSLLGDQINISEITLDNPQIWYNVYADSSTNIDFLMQQEAEQDTTSGYNVNIPHFQINSGDIWYRDATSDTRAELQEVNATLSLQYADLIQSTLDLQVGGLSAVMEGSEMTSNLPLSLSQESTIDLDEEQMTLDEGTFSIRGLALNLEGSVSSWSQTPTVDLNFTSSSDDFGELLGLIPESYEDQIRDLETNGSLAVDGAIQGAVGGESVPDFNVSIQVSDGYVKYPDVPQPVQNIQISAEGNNGLITVERFSAEAADNIISGSGSLADPLEDQGEVKLDAELDFDLATIKDFYPIDEDTLTLRGDLVGQVMLQGTIDQLEQAVQGGSLNLTNGYIAHQTIAKPLEDITIESTLDGPVVRISNASFRSGNNNLTASGSISDYLSENPSVDISLTGEAALEQIADYYDLSPSLTELGGQADIDLRIKGAPASPAEMQFNGSMVVQEVHMAGEALVQPVSNLNGQLSLSPSAATLNALSFDLGSSDISLSGSLNDYMEYLKAEEDRATTPHLEGSYQSSRLNLDELINWDDTTTSAAPIHLPDLTSAISAEVSEMIITGVTMQNLKASATTTPEQIELQEAVVQLFNGRASGAFVWEVPQPDQTNITFSGSLDSLQAQAFFEEYQILGENSRLHEYLNGAFSANVDYATTLNEYLEPLIETSEMDGSMGMTQARLQGHPLQAQLANLFNAQEFQNVALDEWQSRFNMENSILTLEDLSLTSDDIGLVLNGTQHLTNETIDYQLQLLLPGRYKGAIASVITKQAAEALAQDNGTFMVPLRVQGSQNSPRINPDEEVITPIVKEYMKDKAGNVLNRIFNR